jgi:hypothetical protein
MARRAITLTEVLISLGILTIGLLGVAALFPVGSYYLQKGEIADRGSAIAQAAFNDASARGMFNPKNWLMYNAINPNLSPTTPPAAYIQPFQATLSQRIQQYVTTPTATRNRQLNLEFGSMYVIDPLGADGSTTNPNSGTTHLQVPMAQTFPFNASISGYEWGGLWTPWNPPISNPTPGSAPKWPALRLTLPQLPGQPLTTDVARKLVSTSDDLSLDVPPQANKVSVQRWEKDGGGNPLARQARGDYSWFVTVVPSSTAARDALASDPSAYDYEVSVVVCYKRFIDDWSPVFSGGTIIPTERLTQASVVSTGLNGGQVLLNQAGSDQIVTGTPLPDPYAGLKAGQWVAVCGPHPSSTDTSPLFVFHWYRVLAVDKEPNGILTDPKTQRLVSLSGPPWPWQPTGALLDTSLSNNLCLAIVPGAVAVHSKTIRLEGNSAWSVQ